MYKWLEAELAAVDRNQTPWLIIQMHASFYSTSLVHSYEVECMRQTYEPLFRKYGVDLVLSGVFFCFFKRERERERESVFLLLRNVKFVFPHFLFSLERNFLSLYALKCRPRP